MDNNTRLIRNIIYDIKRKYRQKVVLYRRTETVANIKKGTQTTYYRPYPINKAAQLPAELTREEHPNVKGLWRSYYDQEITTILVDGRDIPIRIEEDDLVQIKEEQFRVSKVDDAGDGRSYMVRLKAVEAFERLQNIDLHVKSDMFITAEVSNV